MVFINLNPKCLMSGGESSVLNVNTNAKVVWKFNICHGNAFQNHDQATVTTSYLANAS